MDTDLHAIVVALAGLTDDELLALIDATYKAPQVAPGLIAWIHAACDWELHRRQGRDYPLRPPEAEIPPEEDAVSNAAAMAMRATIAKDSPAVLALFDVLVAPLTGEGRRH